MMTSRTTAPRNIAAGQLCEEITAAETKAAIEHVSANSARLKKTHCFSDDSRKGSDVCECAMAQYDTPDMSRKNQVITCIKEYLKEVYYSERDDQEAKIHSVFDALRTLKNPRGAAKKFVDVTTPPSARANHVVCDFEKSDCIITPRDFQNSRKVIICLDSFIQIWKQIARNRCTDANGNFQASVFRQEWSGYEYEGRLCTTPFEVILKTRARRGLQDLFFARAACYEGNQQRSRLPWDAAADLY